MKMAEKELREEYAKISVDNLNYFLFITNLACNNYHLALESVETLHLPKRLETSLKAQIQILSKAMSHLINKFGEGVINGSGTSKR